MPERESYKHGEFCWIDLATTDGEGAKSFYTQLFGWDAEEMPTPGAPEMIYSMYSLNGKYVAASYQMGEEQAATFPPYWTSYVRVDSVDEVEKKAREAGGTVMMESSDVGDSGRVCIFSDPTGAVIGTWEPKEMIGAGLVTDPGGFTWNELLTSDPAKARDFYAAVFGWGTQDTEMEGGTYTVFMAGETMAGGMMQATEQWGNIPPHWGVYFAVEDCDAAVARAQELGAKLQVEPQDVPTVGRFAQMADPQGAHFWVIKNAPPQS